MPKEYSYSLNDVLNNLKSFLGFVLKKWLLFLLVVLAGIGLALVYYSIQKPKYKAVTTFILEEKSSGSGGIAGLASQFGINLGSLTSGGSLFTGDNILNILKSKNVVQKVLLTRIDYDTLESQTLADFYLAYAGIKKKWQKKPLLADINFTGVKGKMSPLQDSVLNVIYEKILKQNLYTERTSKQGTIIKVQMTAENSLFARLMAERLVDEAGKLYLDIKTGTAEANIRQLQRRADSLLLLLNNKSFTVAASQPLDINPAMRTAVVPVEIATRDKTVLATLYAEVTKNLEASKLLLSQQIPVIQLLDRPAYLLDDNKKGLFLLLVVFSFSAGFMYIAGAFLFFIFFRASPTQGASGKSE